MLKKSLQLFLLVFMCNLGFSQDTLVLDDGESLQGEVIIIDKKKVYFEDAESGKRKWYKKVESVTHVMEDRTIEYKMRDIKGFTSYLIGIMEEGAVTYYVYHKYVPGYGAKTSTGMMKSGNTQPFFFLYKADGEILKDTPNSLTTPYVKRMASYFSDCPALVEKIEAEEYEFGDTGEAVKFYNENCGS